MTDLINVIRWLTPIMLCAAALLSAQSMEDAHRPHQHDSIDPDVQSSGVETILDQYYRSTFGGVSNWRQIQSMRFHGVLKLPHGMMEFVAFKKKPNYCKVVLFGANGTRLVFASDGEDAWQLVMNGSVEVVDMPEGEAINFMRDASIEGHLLHPHAPGKQVDLLAIEEVSGSSCYRFQIRLRDDQVVEYFIDMEDCIERRRVVTNAVTGQLEVTDFFEHRKVSGLKIPFRTVLSVDGEQVHEVRLLDVDVNLGLTSWMFSRESSAYVVNPTPSKARSTPSTAFDLSLPGEDWGLSSGFQMPEIDPTQREQLLLDIEPEL